MQSPPPPQYPCLPGIIIYRSGVSLCLYICLRPKTRNFIFICFLSAEVKMKSTARQGFFPPLSLLKDFLNSSVNNLHSTLIIANVPSHQLHASSMCKCTDWNSLICTKFLSILAAARTRSSITSETHSNSPPERKLAFQHQG